MKYFQGSKIKIKSNFGNQIKINHQVSEHDVQFNLIWSVEIKLIIKFAFWSSTPKNDDQFLRFEDQPRKLMINYCVWRLILANWRSFYEIWLEVSIILPILHKINEPAMQCNNVLSDGSNKTIHKYNRIKVRFMKGCCCCG